MRRLLVTGGAGFIGSHFVEHWLRHGLADRVVVLDALTYAGRRTNLAAVGSDPRFRFVHGNICDPAAVEALLREEALDLLVNFAAETHVDRSIAAPADFVRTNIDGVASLLDAARRVWLHRSGIPHRFHQISTDEVFGPRPADAPARDESAPYAPTSPYAASKAAADHLVQSWRRTYGLDASISYSSNVYGPRQYPEKLIPVAIRCVLAHEPVPLYGDGQQRRAWLHVRDFCRAIEMFFRYSAAGSCLYLGGNQEIANMALVQKLADIAGRSPSSVIHVADRAGHDRSYGISAAAFERISGFSPEIALERGLADTFDWYQRNSTGTS